MGSSLLAPGRLGSLLGAFFWFSKEPLDAPGLPRGALATLLGRPGDAPRRSRDASGAPWVPRGQFLVEFGYTGCLPGAFPGIPGTSPVNILGTFFNRFFKTILRLEFKTNLRKCLKVACPKGAVLTGGRPKGANARLRL